MGSKAGKSRPQVRGSWAFWSSGDRLKFTVWAAAFPAIFTPFRPHDTNTNARPHARPQIELDIHNGRKERLTSSCDPHSIPPPAPSRNSTRPHAPRSSWTSATGCARRRRAASAGRRPWWAARFCNYVHFHSCFVVRSAGRGTYWGQSIFQPRGFIFMFHFSLDF